MERLTRRRVYHVRHHHGGRLPLVLSENGTDVQNACHPSSRRRHLRSRLFTWLDIYHRIRRQTWTAEISSLRCDYHVDRHCDTGVQL